MSQGSVAAMYRGDAARTGEYPLEDRQAGFRPWRYWAGGAVRSSPTVVDGVVYLTNDCGVSETSSATHYPPASATVHALDALTGAPRWRARPVSGSESSPAVVPDVLDGGSRTGVFFGGDDGNVYALDAYTGAQVWAYQTDEWSDPPYGRTGLGCFIKSSPAVAGGTVYIGGPDARLLALAADSGEPRWAFQTNEEIFAGKPHTRPLGRDRRSYVMVGSSPAVVEGTVYLCGADFHAYALDATTGSPRWSRRVGSTASPAVTDGTMYVGGSDAVHALDAGSGEPRWEHPDDRFFFSRNTPAVAGGIVYVAGYGREEGVLLALDAATGSVHWRRRTRRGMLPTSPAVARGLLYVAGRGPRWAGAFLVALDAATGKVHWRRRLNSPITLTCAPVVAGGVVYAGGTAGHLYAFDAATGAPRPRRVTA